jgi:phosphoribosylpyrophosphate synthetase
LTGEKIVDGTEYFKPLGERASKHMPPVDRVFHPQKYEAIDIDALHLEANGKKVVVVEDIYTTGGSVKDFVGALHDAGIETTKSIGYFGDTRFGAIHDPRMVSSLIITLKNSNLPSKVG